MAIFGNTYNFLKGHFGQFYKSAQVMEAKKIAKQIANTGINGAKNWKSYHPFAFVGGGAALGGGYGYLNGDSNRDIAKDVIKGGALGGLASMTWYGGRDGFGKVKSMLKERGTKKIADKYMAKKVPLGLPAPGRGFVPQNVDSMLSKNVKARNFTGELPSSGKVYTPRNTQIPRPRVTMADI